MNLKPDSYSVYARVFPALVAALPLLILFYFCGDQPDLRALAQFLAKLRFYGAISLSLVFLYLLSQICRVTAKAIEARYFTRARGFPTTYLLMYADPAMSRHLKDLFRKRVKHVLGISLLDEEGERQDPGEARKRLNDTAKMVILKVGSGKLVQKHNVWYGFLRNTIGGSIYAVGFCLTNIVYGHYVSGQSLLVHLSIILLVMYAVLLVFNKVILVQNAEGYAKQLIAEFMST